MLRLILVASLAAGTVHAAETTSCPTTLDGHKLIVAGGASLYLGDPALQMDMVPSTVAADLRGRNVWQIGNINAPRYVTLVCRYAGGAVWTRRLPDHVKTCLQDLAGPSMVCG